MGKIHTFIFNQSNASKVWTTTARFWTFNSDFSVLPYNKKFKTTFRITTLNYPSLNPQDAVFILGCDLPIENSFYTTSNTLTGYTHFAALGIIDFNQRNSIASPAPRYLDIDVDQNPPVICKKPNASQVSVGMLNTLGNNIGGLGGGGTMGTELTLILYMEEIDE